MTVVDLAELKKNERTMWALGDYAAIARDMFWAVGERVVARVEVAPGERVLDVACGTGNAAIRAAEAGGLVTGVDLTPELFETGRALAAEAGATIEWVEGDAEALPFEDESFDVVLSTFGCMFAPRHDVTARELARVLRPGGRLGVCSWTPDSSLATMMRAMFGHLPPTPDFALPPPLWGSPDHIRDLFDGTGIRVECERESVTFNHVSVEAALQTYETTWGPFIQARQQLEPHGRWLALRAELAAVLAQRNTSDGADLVYSSDYLTVVGRRTT